MAIKFTPPSQEELERRGVGVEAPKEPVAATAPAPAPAKKTAAPKRKE